MNFEAQPLQKHEIASMNADLTVRGRIQRSYEIMLGFYGMELVSKETGELRRASNWQERYRNLMREHCCPSWSTIHRPHRLRRGTT